jgi:hypothetical protein
MKQHHRGIFRDGAALVFFVADVLSNWVFYFLRYFFMSWLPAISHENAIEKVMPGSIAGLLPDRSCNLYLFYLFSKKTPIRYDLISILSTGSFPSPDRSFFGHLKAYSLQRDNSLISTIGCLGFGHLPSAWILAGCPF